MFRSFFAVVKLPTRNTKYQMQNNILTNRIMSEHFDATHAFADENKKKKNGWDITPTFYTILFK